MGRTESPRFRKVTPTAAPFIVNATVASERMMSATSSPSFADGA
eukprot:CAMPEP_0179111628 /NCGR_PEP_ID=MMETSP0796-20121207/52144_1 /TAXON_ID=73915 /ORGANISM="Pyrodinium bahamense, Strain pbaha01" /LENGTH=43 /DNA_ID= /DNA_START= /DNA_END= /DNA_ORIENTATION=